jgi:RimJ/RimL family protein N-acetyltransferase
MSVLFYRWTGGPLPNNGLQDQHTVYFWRPSNAQFWPPEMPFRASLLKAAVQYSLLHRLGRFMNPDYAICWIGDRNSLAHVSFIYPGYFRFPFMSETDLQIGDTWTDPAHRGKGLAGHAIRASLGKYALPGRAFWYLCDSDNQASRQVIEKMGFQKVGEGLVSKRLGLGLLGTYKMTSDHSH